MERIKIIITFFLLFDVNTIQFKITDAACIAFLSLLLTSSHLPEEPFTAVIPSDNDCLWSFQSIVQERLAIDAEGCLLEGTSLGSTGVQVSG